ncbi:hypothetical protein QBC35DRAFT_283524 [Podospora australis]|uniref:BTB domain-containing protein n=1 Tax=Podospora australis TaxID=1536484 RepID=A0AAN6WTI5_9PEZI|nr:hypothetical protein QBC35DRAFT_283524 [Podospora australis]
MSEAASAANIGAGSSSLDGGGGSSSGNSGDNTTTTGTSASVSASANGNGGEGSSSSSSFTTGRPSPTAAPGVTRTLGDAMRAPSMILPDVVTLDSLPETHARRSTLNPKEDLWLCTTDGRYNAPIIPLHVGLSPVETFYVHKSILLKSEWFEKALCGSFRESDTQSINLPEEDPGIFHFLVAYLYEGRYDPIRPVATVLIPDRDKGKGPADADMADNSDTDSVSSYESGFSAISRRRRDRRRRREDRQYERMRQKHYGIHRPNCSCPQCNLAHGPPCWSCRAPRAPPPIPAPPHPNVIVVEPPLLPPDRRHGNNNHRGNRQGPRPPRNRPVPPPPPPPAAAPGPITPPAPGSSTWDYNGGRISGEEDMRTWLMTYELNIDVYIMANKFLLEGLKKEIARSSIDMLESAGSDAAVPQVLFLCKKMYEGLPENDPLMRMIFARVGFLQPWRRAPEETTDWLMDNPEIAPLLLKEMAARREEDFHGRVVLPSMEQIGDDFAAAPSAGFGTNGGRGVGGVYGGGGPGYDEWDRANRGGGGGGGGGNGGIPGGPAGNDRGGYGRAGLPPGYHHPPYGYPGPRRGW